MECKDAAATNTNRTEERRCAKTKLRPSPCANFVPSTTTTTTVGATTLSAESAVSSPPSVCFRCRSYRSGRAAIIIAPRNSAASPKGFYLHPVLFFLSGLSQEKNHVMCLCGASAQSQALLKGQYTKTEAARMLLCACIPLQRPQHM